MKVASVALTIGFVLAFGIPAGAHHAFAVPYILDQTMTIDGTIVQFDVRNPHSFLTVEVKDADGKSTRWGVEWGSVSLLASTRVTKFTLKVGDKVTVSGAPPRGGTTPRMMLEKIRRPSDGFSWGDRPGEVVPGYTPATPAAPAPANR